MFFEEMCRIKQIVVENNLYGFCAFLAAGIALLFCLSNSGDDVLSKSNNIVNSSSFAYTAPQNTPKVTEETAALHETPKTTALNKAPKASAASNAAKSKISITRLILFIFLLLLSAWGMCVVVFYANPWLEFSISFLGLSGWLIYMNYHGMLS